MKTNEKKFIGILLVILVIAIIVAVVIVNRNNNQEGTVNNTDDYVSVLRDGTKLNTSEKLNKTKTVGGFEFSDIQLTEKGNQTVLLATVTNKTSEDKDFVTVDVKLVDKSGKEIVTVTGIISPLKAGESTQFNTSMTLSYVDAYDFEIIIK